MRDADCGGAAASGHSSGCRRRRRRSPIVDVGRARLETATWGSGEPVILLPGTGYSSTSFRLVGPEIARRGYRAIAVNPRGVGGSTGPLDGLTYHDYAADVGALVDRIAAAGRMSSGWAWGNRIARTLAADAPQRVASVVLIAAGGKVPADPIVAETTARLREPGLTQDERTKTLALRLLAPGSDPRRSFLSRNHGRRRRRRRPPPAAPRGSRSGGRAEGRRCS